MIEHLRNLHCRVANAIGLEYCVCCGRWHWRMKMDREYPSFCRRCGTHQFVQNTLTKAGLIPARRP